MEENTKKTGQTLTTTEVVPVVSETQELPSIRTQQLIRRIGTPEDIARLDAKLDAVKKNIPLHPDELKATEYLQKVEAIETEKKRLKVDIGTAASRWITNRRFKKRERPEEVTYKNTRTIIFDFYELIVKQSRGKMPDIEKLKKEPSVLRFFKNYTHWLIGSADGEFDPKKNLYVYGETGVGKSSICRAGLDVLDFYAAHLGWSPYRMSYFSMHEEFYKLKTSQDITPFNRLSKGQWLIDELKKDHATHKHFGSEIPLINALLFSRHDLWEKTGARTIITTNIVPELLASMVVPEHLAPSARETEKKRLKGRMIESFNTYLLEGPDKRNPEY